jgi:hypothetical protein
MFIGSGVWPYATPAAAVAGLEALRRVIGAGLLLGVGVAHALLESATHCRTLKALQFIKVSLLA